MLHYRQVDIMQKAIIYLTSNLSNKPNDLLYFHFKFHPLVKTAFKNLLMVSKVYIEKKSREKTYFTSFHRLTTYLKKHKEIENVILNDDERIIENEKDFIALLELERTVYLVGTTMTKVITVGEYEKDKVSPILKRI